MTQQSIPRQRPADLDVPDDVDEELSRVRALVGRLEETPRSVELATSLNRSITGLAKHRTTAVFEFLHELGDLPLLARAKDQNGWPCRAAALSTWLELGYPYALELTPEDLQYVREHAPGGGTGWLNATWVLGVFSALLNVPATLFIVVSLMSLNLQDLLFALPTALMSLHAVALVSMVHLDRPAATNVSWLRRLGGIGLLGPIAAALSSLWLGAGGACLLAGCLPMGLASLTALAAARVLKPR